MTQRTTRAVAVLLSAAAALLPTPLRALDLPQVKAAGVVRAIVAADEQPERFRRQDGGEPGLEREILEGFARLHGVKLEAVTVPHYNDRIPALLAGKGDLIVGIFDTPERRAQIEFTPEVVPERMVVVSHAPHRVVKAAAELRTEKVGLLEGTTTWRKAALDAGVAEAALRGFRDLETLFAALRAGEITATVMPVADYGIARAKHPGLQAGCVVGLPRSAAWGVRKEDRQLLAALGQHLSAFRQTPSWSRLIVKYFGDEALRVLGRE